VNSYHIFVNAINRGETIRNIGQGNVVENDIIVDSGCMVKSAFG
jgi:hypothetical protein